MHNLRITKDIVAQHIGKPCVGVTHSDDAVLTSSCFCNNSLLSHASAKKGLPQGVVDLVCPCVVQVFPLEIDFWPSVLAAHVQLQVQCKLKPLKLQSVC